MHLSSGATRGLLKITALVGLIGLADPITAWAGKPDTRSPNQAILEKHLSVLLDVGREGQGNIAALTAWQVIAAADAEALPDVLASLDRAEPQGANYIASAAETIVERTLRERNPLPIAGLKKFVRDTGHAPRARRLAFEWLTSTDETAAAAMIPGFLYDPSPELRREAVARLLNEAAAKKGAHADDQALRTLYREALSGACDLDQVKTVKSELERLGEKVDLARHFGFITSWYVIGPFDNRGEKAFDAVYPPEQNIDLTAEYEGKPRDGQTRTVAWRPATTQDEFGILDLNKAIGQENGVVGYSWTEFWSDRERPAELRLGRDNAAKLWLNGQIIHEHRVYHSGSEMDQFVGRGTLKQGRNTILVKALQNEQKEEWAQGWGFQLRVCDSAGQAILSTKDNSDEQRATSNE
jgi:hypothetical protein